MNGMLEIIDRGILSRVSGRGTFHPWITPLAEDTFIFTHMRWAELRVE